MQAKFKVISRKRKTRPLAPRLRQRLKGPQETAVAISPQASFTFF
jgi:hypothetical protein